MLVLLVLVIASPSFVSGVMSRQNLTSSDVTIGRNTVSPHSAYFYYDGHSSSPDTSSPSYYTPATHYHQYVGKWALVTAAWRGLKIRRVAVADNG
jgi:hypothetical protein